MGKMTVHGLQRKLLRLLAFTLILVLTLNVLSPIVFPVDAASGEIVVKTKKQLVKAMEKKSAATIIFRTNRKTRFIIPVIENSANKKLIMEAPNARAFNKATFKTITLNSSGYFNERGNENSLYVKGDGVKLTVSKGIEAKKVSITATDVLIKVASDANVNDIICNKKASEITLSVAKNAEANITIKKTAALILDGDNTADIKVVAQAKDTKITASVPVDIVAEKDVDVVLEKGSEGSSIDSAKGVDVDLSGAAEKNATVVEDGKMVQEAEEKKDEETAVTDPGKEEEKKEDEKTEDKADTVAPDATSSDPGSSNSYVPSPPPSVNYPSFTWTFDESQGTVSVSCGSKPISSGAQGAPGSIITITVLPSGNYYADITTGDPNNIQQVSETDWQIKMGSSDTSAKITFSAPTRTYIASVSGSAISVSGGAINASGALIIYRENAEIKLETPLSESGIHTSTVWTHTSERREVKTVDFSRFTSDGQKAWLTENIINCHKNLFPYADTFIIPRDLVMPVIDGVTFAYSTYVG